MLCSWYKLAIRNKLTQRLEEKIGKHWIEIKDVLKKWFSIKGIRK